MDRSREEQRWLPRAAGDSVAAESSVAVRRSHPDGYPGRPCRLRKLLAIAVGDTANGTTSGNYTFTVTGTGSPSVTAVTTTFT